MKVQQFQYFKAKNSNIADLITDRAAICGTYHLSITPHHFISEELKQEIRTDVLLPCLNDLFHVRP